MAKMLVIEQSPWLSLKIKQRMNGTLRLVCANQETFKKHLKKDAFDLILLDLDRGIDVARAIRLLGYTSPIIVCTVDLVIREQKKLKGLPDIRVVDRADDATLVEDIDFYFYEHSSEASEQISALSQLAKDINDAVSLAKNALAFKM